MTNFLSELKKKKLPLAPSDYLALRIDYTFFYRPNAYVMDSVVRPSYYLRA
jgi:hypothetical protein